jgi:methyl-accepting chemotaxis protein
MNLDDLKISTRLVLVFGLLTSLMALMGGFLMVKANHVGDAFDTVVDDRYVKIAALNNVKDGLNQIARSLRNALIFDDPADIRKQLVQVRSSQEGILDQWQLLESRIVDEEGKSLLASAMEKGSQYRALEDKFVGLVANGRMEEAKGILLGDLRPAQLAYLAGVGDLIAFQKAAMDEAATQASGEIASMKAIIWASGGVAIVIAFLMGIWIIRSVTRPLALAVRISRAVAGGDLSQQFEAAGKNETAQLLQALKDMQASLVTVVSSVRRNAEAVAASSEQIARGNADLSQRTEEQAASLQETASSMEELTGTVRHNTDNAKQATRLATTASGMAQRGGTVVGQVIETMQGISDSSARVTEIIGVIEGIAFQTNILALNAAVEAARAGEHGRGFAVVAGEIRTLAQRSATAAKEINELIGESVSRVDVGAKLVEEAGSTIGEAVQEVQRVTDLMGEIAAASEEQSTGIGQINAAVVQLDRVTHQNAVLVEEASAAAQSLVRQAEALRDAVAVFHIGGHDADQPSTALVVSPRPIGAEAELASADRPRARALVPQWQAV